MSSNLPPVFLMLWLPASLLSLMVVFSNFLYVIYWLIKLDFCNYSDYITACSTIWSLFYIKLIGVSHLLFWDSMIREQQLADFYYVEVHPTLIDTLVWGNHIAITYPGIADHLKSLSDGTGKLSILDPKLINLCPGFQHFHLVMGIFGRILIFSILVIWLNITFTCLNLSRWLPLSLVMSLLTITINFIYINHWLIEEQGYYTYSDFNTASYTIWSLLRIRMDALLYTFTELISDKPEEDYYIRIHPTHPETLIWGKYEVTYPGISYDLKFLSAGTGRLHILDPLFIRLCPGFLYFKIVARIFRITLACGVLVMWLQKLLLKRWLKREFKKSTE